jgi:LuxR family maltose regulon positive regulatory protein
MIPLSERPTELVLVLDDYHFIQQQSIHSGVKHLIQYMPKGMHLVVASRVTPPLDLSSLRVRGELNEIKAGDLRFTKPEALEFYNQTMELDLDMEQVKAIESHTEGWAAASQLAALKLRNGQKPASLAALLTNQGGLVSEYLMQEVINKQSPELRDFLMTISILERVCDPLCEALMDSAKPPITLKRLAQEILFLAPLDDEGRWYRLPHLFRSLLRGWLTEQAGERVAGLHKKASEWFTSKELLLEAGEHAIASKNRPYLADFIEHNKNELIASLGYDVLSKWLHYIPDAILQERPKLAILRAWCSILEDGTSSPEYEIDRAVKAVNGYQKRELSKENSLLQHSEGEIGAMRATLCMVRGEYEEAVRTTQSALENLPEDNPRFKSPRSRLNLIAGRALWHFGDSAKAITFYKRAEQESRETGDFYTRYQAIFGRASSLATLTHLNKAYLLCKESLVKAKEERCDLIGPVGNLHCTLSAIHLLRHEPELQLAEANRAIEILRLTLEQHTLTWSYVFQVTMMLTYVYRSLAKSELNDSEGALSDVNESFELSKQFINRNLCRWVEEYKVLIEAKNGIFTHLGHLLEKYSDFKISPRYSDQETNLVHILLKIMTNEPEAALQAIEPSLNYAMKYGLGLHIVRLKVSEAAALALAGKREQALAPLEQAIELSLPERITHFFYTYRAQLQPLVPDLKSAEARDFLALAIGDKDRISSRPPPSLAPPVSVSYNESTPAENLSQRELEVLSLIAKGFSNGEIAKGLFVTLGTIKTHIHNILTKLNAKSRTHAVRIAKEYKMLDGNISGV